MSDGWRLVYEDFVPEQEGLRETLCTLGNGVFFARGAAPDAWADGVHYPGTYLAGGYDRLTTRIAGRDIENEDLVNLPNWLVFTIRIEDGPWLRPAACEHLDYRQELDLERGLLSRSLRFRDPEGRTLRWRERRLMSLQDPHLAGLEIELTAEDWSGRLTLRSGLDGSVINDGVPRYRNLEGRHLETLGRGRDEAGPIWLLSRTVQSRLEVAMAARLRLFLDEEAIAPERTTDAQADLIAEEASVEMRPGRVLRAEKIAALHSARDNAISQPALAARERATHAPDFPALLEDHARAWSHMWEQYDLRLETGDDHDAQLKLRLHLFHLAQTVTRHTAGRDVGVPPRGWTGEAYRAHIMWDELFVFPLFNLRCPARTRSVLLYRYHRLDAARRLARSLGLEGACFPWQSGSDGREESQVIHLNPASGRWIPDTSNRQRHISSAVAYNVWHYYEVTGDQQFLCDHGAEMLIEIARFWASLAQFNPGRERYEIRGVMGPDEFHTAYPGRDPSTEGGLDNNAYTNVLAAWVFNRARDALEVIPPDHARRLRESLGLTDRELELWFDISRKLFVPFHDGGVISQFEGYETLEEFDWEGAREKHGDIQRLDRILEAEGDDPNRYKASKQADVLMLFYIFSADELAMLFEQLGYPFDAEMIPRNVEYYLARTSHGSTLSWIVHSWVLARGDRRNSWRLFRDALDSDIADIQGGTTPEGVHLGAMAGTVDLIQRAYLGIETRGSVLHFNPALPDDLDCLGARMVYRGQELDVTATKDRLRIESRPLTADPVMIAYRGRFRSLSPGNVREFRLIRPEERDRAESDACRPGGADAPAGEPIREPSS